MGLMFSVFGAGDLSRKVLGKMACRDCIKTVIPDEVLEPMEILQMKDALSAKFFISPAKLIPRIVPVELTDLDYLKMVDGKGFFLKQETH